MSWEIVERKIGRAGGVKRRAAKQREWDRKYGDWAIGYVVEGEFVTQDDAIETIYYQSYADHFENKSDDLFELINLAKILRNPHAAATTGVDLQVPAITEYLKRHRPGAPRQRSCRHRNLRREMFAHNQRPTQPTDHKMLHQT